MKIKLFLIIIVIHVMALPLKAQDSTRFRKNKASVELLGSRLDSRVIISFNYERVFKKTKKFEFSAEAGYSFIYPGQTFRGCWLPLHFNIIYTKYRIEPEIDLGITNVIDFKPNPKTREERKDWIETGRYEYENMSPPYLLNYTPRIGVRYHYNDKLFGKLMFSPIMRYTKYYGSGIYPCISFSFGINF